MGTMERFRRPRSRSKRQQQQVWKDLSCTRRRSEALLGLSTGPLSLVTSTPRWSFPSSQRCPFHPTCPWCEGAPLPIDLQFCIDKCNFSVSFFPKALPELGSRLVFWDSGLGSETVLFHGCLANFWKMLKLLGVVAKMESLMAMLCGNLFFFHYLINFLDYDLKLLYSKI